VRTVADGSPADEAGIAVGDLIVQAGDRAVTTVDDLHQAMDAARSTRELVLTIVRGAEETTRTVVFGDAEPEG
jgi:S1-C subfamily serine protease